MTQKYFIIASESTVELEVVTGGTVEASKGSRNFQLRMFIKNRKFTLFCHFFGEDECRNL